MLGEIIVIDSDEIDTISKEGAPYESRISASWSQLNEFHFSSLWSILSGESGPEEVSSKLKVLTARDGEVWVVVFPAELTRHLAARLGENNASIVREWSAIEEFEWGWTEEDVGKLFSDLATLGEAALSNNKALIYWGAL